jgi:tripartite-type tricarboxylate transporter receptor subunit TctC
MQRRLVLIAAVFCSLCSSLAMAAGYPDHPIEFIVPSSAGGGTDVMSRNYAEAARKYMAQTIVVTNKPGASGGIGMGEVQRATPDGYKVSVLISELAIIPHMNMIKFTSADFIPIARLNGDPGTITVRADAPWKTVEEFLANAKSKPGEVSMGNAGAGSIWHLAAAAVEEKSGAKFNHVPFQGAAPAVQGLMGGHVDAIAVSPAEVSSFVAAGKLKTLAIMSDQRLTGLYATVPTFKERGIDLSIGTWRGLGVPLGTPPEVVTFLRDLTRKVADDAGYKEAMAKSNLLTWYQEGDQFKTFMASQSDYFKTLLATIKVDKQ